MGTPEDGGCGVVCRAVDRVGVKTADSSLGPPAGELGEAGRSLRSAPSRLPKNSRAVHIGQTPSRAGVQVSLTPPAARALLGLPPGALASTVFGLDEVLGRPARELTEQLREAPTWETRFDLLEALHLTPIAATLTGGGKLRVSGREVSLPRRVLFQPLQAALEVGRLRVAEGRAVPTAPSSCRSCSIRNRR